MDQSGRVRYRVQEGIGSEKAPAPQATLMSLVTKGILTQQLPWGLVLLGVFTSILMEIIGVPALAFAVGMYLPLESTTPVFLGGLALPSGRVGSKGPRRSPTPAPASSSARGSWPAARSSASLRRSCPHPSSRSGRAVSPSGGEAVPQAVGFLLFLGLAFLIYRTAARRSRPA